MKPLPPLENFSVMRVLRRLADGNTLDGLEGEVHAELAKRALRPPQGALIPLHLLGARRSLDTTTGGCNSSSGYSGRR